MEKLKIALDWTPNTNHTGFFVADALGFYANNNVEIELLSPATDAYTLTPAKRLELGEIDVAVAPLESAISLNTKHNPVPVKAIATLLQDDLSAIATLKRDDITSPKHLDGKTYASYKARYEDDIVRQLIVNDGGTGNSTIQYPDKLNIWDTLLTGQADATWIFTNWEGIEAETRNVELTYFKLADYAVPYGYSPVLIARADAITQKRDVYRRFLRATKQGFLYAARQPEESSRILWEHLSENDRKAIDVVKSQLQTGPHYGTEATWGKMDTSVVTNFVDWLRAIGSETSSIPAASIFTNELLA